MLCSYFFWIVKISNQENLVTLANAYIPILFKVRTFMH